MTDLMNRLSRQSRDPQVLAAIGAPDCNLAIWQRPAFADFAALVTGDPRDLRFVSDPGGLAAHLVRGLAEAGFGGDAGLRRALAADAAQLAQRYCSAMDLARCEVRLEVVRTDSCRKFHADYVTARLITTYVGEGTDWLDEADAARVAAGHEPQRINRMAPFDVGLFKGRRATASPAIHRSPPIRGSAGGVRLLLVLNPVSEPFVDEADSPLPPPGHLA